MSYKQLSIEDAADQFLNDDKVTKATLNWAMGYISKKEFMTILEARHIYYFIELHETGTDYFEEHA
jgi:hypothetical protein